jgi:hypothetical protein
MTKHAYVTITKLDWRYSTLRKAENKKLLSIANNLRPTTKNLVKSKGRVRVQNKVKWGYLVGALWRSHDGCLPVKEIVSDGSGRALCGRVATQILKFLKNKQNHNCNLNYSYSQHSWIFLKSELSAGFDEWKNIQDKKFQINRVTS